MIKTIPTQIRENRGHMKALVYKGPGRKAWEEVPMPTIQDNTDAIVRVDCTTICGTDLHILEGDVPAVTEGRVLGGVRIQRAEPVGRVQRIVSAEVRPDHDRCRPDL